VAHSMRTAGRTAGQAQALVMRTRCLCVTHTLGPATTQGSKAKQSKAKQVQHIQHSTAQYSTAHYSTWAMSLTGSFCARVVCCQTDTRYSPVVQSFNLQRTYLDKHVHGLPISNGS
jgi:hypothetical protein